MAATSWNSLTEMFLAQVEKHSSKALTHYKTDGVWESLSWSDILTQVATISNYLVKIGVEPGDRVVLLSENRPEFLISDLAIMAAGAISVPTYTTYTSPDYNHICDNSSAKAAIVSSKALAKKFMIAAHESDALTDLIIVEELRVEQALNVNLHCWDDIMAAGDSDTEKLKERSAKLTRDDIACLIYTSGTGGSPKGVKIHHGAILHNCEACSTVLEPVGGTGNTFLSFLPLSHAYEHTAGQFFPLSTGSDIWYAEGLEKLAANMAEAKPTVMVVVPRLFEMLRNRLTRQIEKEGGLKQKLFNRAIQLGTKRLDPGSPSLGWIEQIEDFILTRTVRAQVRKRFGGRLKALVSGGAPLNPDIGYFFAALGLPLLQGYGQTESGPVASVNPPHKPKMNTVGPALKNTEIKIARDGEILIRGELVMKGYWNDKTATERTIIDGWLHTGDIGELDEDGYLLITDRKKDIIVNDKGDNVSPQRIEGMLALEEEIAQAMVYGDRKPHLVGLIVPDSEWLIQWARANKKSRNLADIRNDRDLIKAISTAVGRINARLTNLEKVRKFIIAAEPFSVENEQMTPTLKVRRHMIKEAYGDALEGLY